MLAGSSPLTRGKPRPQAWRLYARRLIPAHAGKTGCHSRGRAYDGAHPRSRGENSDPERRERGHDGSSPLTRGKLSKVPDSVSDAGLIPAHAGKTKSRPAM